MILRSFEIFEKRAVLRNRILILGSFAVSLKNFRGHLIDHLISRGFDVHIAAPELLSNTEICDWAHKRGITVHDVPLSRTGLNPNEDIKLLGQLIRLMYKIRPSTFLGYTAKPVIWGILAAWLTGVPQRVALISGLGYAFIGKANGRRAMVQRIVAFLYSIALRRATLVFFQNIDDQILFKRKKILPDIVSNVVVDGSGVDTEYFKYTPLPNGPKTFLMISRLIGDKGVREYIQAAKNIREDWPEARFHLVGPIDTNPDAIQRSEVLSWHENGWINWFGEVHDVRNAIAASHIYVLPSYREGTPRTVLEAMSMGRPIITTNAPGCRQTVQEGRNGWLVPIADAKTLELVMRKFLENPTSIDTMGRCSRRLAEEKYDVRIVNEAMVTAINLN